jgi:hypothetical protein
MFEKWMDSDLYYYSGEGMLPNVWAKSIELQEIYGLMLNAAKSSSSSQKSIIRISHHQSILTLLSLLVKNNPLFILNNSHKSKHITQTINHKLLLLLLL